MTNEEIRNKVLEELREDKLAWSWEYKYSTLDYENFIIAIDLALKLKEAEHEKEIASLKKQIDMFMI